MTTPAPPNYFKELEVKQNELIRKAIGGSVFVGEYIGGVTHNRITDLTEYTATPTAGRPGIGLAALPASYDDIGWVSEDGAQFSREVDTADVTSWGSLEPTRRDITSDVTTLQVSCQETSATTIGLYLGIDRTSIVSEANTGEVKVDKPTRPSPKFYRVLALAVDENESGEIYIARFLPRASVTEFDDQAFSSGDEPITFPVTFTAYTDSEAGYAERWLFGGPGYNALLSDMGISPATP